MIHKKSLLSAICFSALLVFSNSVAAEPGAAAGTLKQAGKGPLKVFILAGQSNMQGQGTLEAKDDAGKERKGTLRSLLSDPVKAPLIKHLVDAKGDWAEVRDDVWVYDINEFGPVGAGGASLHRCALALGRVYPDALRPAHRPLSLALAAEERRARAVGRAAYREGASHAAGEGARVKAMLALLAKYQRDGRSIPNREESLR